MSKVKGLWMDLGLDKQFEENFNERLEDTEQDRRIRRMDDQADSHFFENLSMPALALSQIMLRPLMVLEVPGRMS